METGLATGSIMTYIHSNASHTYTMQELVKVTIVTVELQFSLDFIKVIEEDKKHKRSQEGPPCEV